MDDYIGNFDTTPEELALIRDALNTAVPDDYDRLIQLCDALAGAEGVKRRHGSFPQEKWDGNLTLKAYFEEKMGKDIYTVTGKGTCPWKN